MKNILITGASGTVGSAVHKHLSAIGYKIFTLDRTSVKSPFHYIESTQQVVLDPAIPLYAVIHLAGPGIADRRWTAARKAFLLSSRERMTRALAEAMAILPVKPSLLLSASAIGYYGLSEGRTVNEDSPPGDDFLAKVATTWEAATAPAEQAGINTIHLRLGVVLSRDGGMLKKLLLPFKLGLGGRIGSGRQYLSWISMHDVVAIIAQLLASNPVAGPLNLVAGNAVSNADFCAQLARALHRPCVIPLPAIVVKILFGEMADAMLLHGSHVQSVKLETLGIRVEHDTLDKAMRAELRN